MGGGASAEASRALPVAAKSGDRKEVERLLARKDTDPNIIDRSTGNTALHYAAAIGHVCGPCMNAFRPSHMLTRVDYYFNVVPPSPQTVRGSRRCSGFRPMISSAAGRDALNILNMIRYSECGRSQ